MIANSDQIVDISITDFIDDCLNRKLDGSILTFLDKELNPKWSFAKINSKELVIEVKEKRQFLNMQLLEFICFQEERIL